MTAGNRLVLAVNGFKVFPTTNDSASEGQCLQASDAFPDFSVVIMAKLKRR